MSKIVVFGLEGEDGLWEADLEAGTVVPLDAGPLRDMEKVAEMRNAKSPMTRGIDFAVTINQAEEEAGGFFEASGGFFEASSGFFEVSGGFFEASSNNHDR